MDAPDLLLVLRVRPKFVYETVVGVTGIVAVVGEIAAPKAVELAAVLGAGLGDDLLIALRRRRVGRAPGFFGPRLLEVFAREGIEFGLALRDPHSRLPVTVKNRSEEYA